MKTGFTETIFDKPYPVTVFPNSSSFEPTPGMAVGVEKCNQYGGERLIVRYDSPPIRKSTKQATQWPRGIVYLAERDVSGWIKANPEGGQ